MAAMYPIVKPWDFTFLRYLDETKNITNQFPTNANDKSILGFIQNSPDFYIFKNLVKIADLEDYLQTQKGITLLLPKDSFISTSINLVKIDKLQARRIVLLSVIPEKLYRKDFITGLYDTKVKPYQLWIEKGKDSVIINKRTKITDYDLDMDNGLIHVLDNFTFSF